MCDDSEPDCELTAIAWQDAGVPHDLTAVLSGDALFAYLEAGKPCHLLLLDMNLPRMTGLEVLAKLKQNEKTAHIPVLMFTSSTWNEEVRAGYAAGASGFLNKPFELPKLVDLMRAIDTYWLTLALIAE